LIYSNDTTRKTYILIDGKLQPIPDRMRMMVPEDLSALDRSPLLSKFAKQAYADELSRAEELKTSAPDHDESVADFVRRHFGDEVLNTLAAPLLSGVFGGDVHKLSVRAVMPQLVAMEREDGSLIAALQSKSKQRTQVLPPIFTSLRNGMASLVDALVAHLPQERIFRPYKVEHLWDDPRWQIIVDDPTFEPDKRPHPLVVDLYDELVFCTPLKKTCELLAAVDYDLRLDRLLPSEASSAVLAAFAWPEDVARSFTIPNGFGFLVPDGSSGEEQLLACTFVDQKFPDRAPEGARVIRAFFGGKSAQALEARSDEVIAVCALEQLREILGPIPEPSFYTVRRWSRSLPQYEVGHLERIERLEAMVAQLPGLHLLGNSYRGVGIPDLIRDARATARAIVEGV
jgi:oxygen-dependent protoporphyrinogen oxidase